jgi:hypothetical protein
MCAPSAVNRHCSILAPFTLMTLVCDGVSVYSSFAGLGSLSGFSTVDPGIVPPSRLHQLTALVICLNAHLNLSRPLTFVQDPRHMGERQAGVARRCSTGLRDPQLTLSPTEKKFPSDGPIGVRRSAQTLRTAHVCHRHTRVTPPRECILRATTLVVYYTRDAALQQAPNSAIAACTRTIRWFNLCPEDHRRFGDAGLGSGHQRPLTRCP